MRSYPLSHLHRNQGDIVDAALKEPVTLTKHGKRKLVVMSAETYERLVRRGPDPRVARYASEAPPEEAAMLVVALESILADSGEDA